MKHLPLFFYKTTWIYIDDDALMTQVMSHSLAQHNRIQTFQSPVAFLNFYDHYQSFLDDQHFLRATHALYPATTHGAYLSGIRAAKEMLA